MKFIPINKATGQEYDPVEANSELEAKEKFEHSTHLAGKYRYELVEEEEAVKPKKVKGVEKEETKE